MGFLMACIFVSLVTLIVFFIGYTITTNSIIKDQEKQIAKLRTDNFRLQAAMRGRHFVKNVEYHDEQHAAPKAQVIEIHDNRIDPENIPEFNNI